MCGLREAELELSELIRKIAAGDAAALVPLYDASSRAVFGLVLRITGDRAAAEEVMVQVYRKALRLAPQYDPNRVTGLAWLLSIARLCAVDRRRASRREPTRIDRLETPAPQAGSVPPSAGPANAPRAVLESLPPEQRVTLELAYYGGMSPGEIAAHLGQPRAAVKTRMRLGMIKLAEELNRAQKNQ